MKSVFLGSVFLASLVAQGAVVMPDDPDQAKFINEENANAWIRRTIPLVDEATGWAATLAVGDTFSCDWLIKARAYASLANKYELGRNGKGWGNSFRFGFGDKTSGHGVGVELDLDAANPKVKMGYDSSVISGGNFSVPSVVKGPINTSMIAGTDHALQYVGNEASMGFRLTRTGADSYDFTFIWGAETNSTSLGGITINAIDNMYLRHDGCEVPDMSIRAALLKASVVAETATTLGLVTS